MGVEILGIRSQAHNMLVGLQSVVTFKLLFHIYDDDDEKRELEREESERARARREGNLTSLRQPW